MINIAILGFGVVGSGVAEVISQNAAELCERLDGQQLNIKYILDKRTFPEHPLGDRVITDFDKIVNDESVMIVVETMGGSHPAYDFSKKALLAGKSVVTSNKQVVAEFGAELLEIAREMGAGYLFEASVGGGIPIIRPMWQCLAANKIDSVAGILNGTCNYILTKMEKENTDFESALATAQKLGYAEKDPTADVGGMDTCRKISILTSLAFGEHVYPEELLCEGITEITTADISFARSKGYAIKLLGISKKADDGKVYTLTAPHLVPESSPLATVNDVYNGILVSGNIVDDVLFCGKGAGSLPTASAVMADVLDIIRDCRKTIGWKNKKAEFLGEVKDNTNRFYVRTEASAEVIKKAFGNVNIESVGQSNVFFTDKMTLNEFEKEADKMGEAYCKIRLID